MVGVDRYVHEFDFEFFVETPKALRSDDWSDRFGGYYVEIVNQTGYEGAGELVEITVINDTGWASATRIPFTDVSILANIPRDYWVWEALCGSSTPGRK